MRLFGMLALTFTLGLAGLSSQSEAAEKVIAEMEFEQSKKSYIAIDVHSNEYEQISTKTKVKMTLTGTGLLSAINQTKTSEETDVAGIDINGYSKLKLIQKGDKVYLAVDALIDDKIDGTDVYLPVKYAAEARFVKGNWSSYQNGDNVQLRLTTEGQKVAAQAVSAKLKHAMSQVRSQLAASIPEIGEIIIEKFVVKGRGLIKGNLSQLTLVGAPVSARLSFGVEI